MGNWTCPSCAGTSLTHVAWLEESFVRWYCDCGATGRPALSGEADLVEVALPTPHRRAPGQASVSPDAASVYDPATDRVALPTSGRSWRATLASAVSRLAKRRGGVA